VKTYVFAMCSLLRISSFAGETSLTPLPAFLTPIEIIEEESGIEDVDCVYVINLKERQERWLSVKEQFSSHKININRVDAVNGWKIPAESRSTLIDPRLSALRKMMLTGGEVGCILSHLSVYQDALERGFETIWVCEDDIRFHGRPEELPSLLEELFFLDPDWDLLYTEHSRLGVRMQRHRPEQIPYIALDQSISDNLARTHGRFGTQSMILSRQGLEKIMFYFYTRYLWSPIDLDLHYIGLREYSLQKGLTKIQSQFRSDTQAISTLRDKK
jgi:GR25 family glycosyltransferase involved in LPS biosynthesis